MMARSTKGSNQRPDTLMQDRTSANSMKVLLQRTAGPYIWVIHDIPAISACPARPQERTYGQCPRLSVRDLRTARSWRGIVPFTHLAREGRMTVTIGRRKLLAALGGAAAAWPLPAWAQQPGKLPT